MWTYDLCLVRVSRGVPENKWIYWGMIGVLSVSCTSSKVFLTSLFIFPKLFYISFVSEVFVLEDLGLSCKTIQMTWFERLGPICLKTLACDTCYISLESWDGCLSVVVFCMNCKCVVQCLAAKQGWTHKHANSFAGHCILHAIATWRCYIDLVRFFILLMV